MSQVPAHRSAPRILHASDPAAIVEIGRLLREGSVVVLPTDTGYGIAASLFQTASVERVYTIKQRDTSLRIPVFIPTSADLPLVVREVPALAWKLIGKFWPGPLSLVLPAGGLGTVAVRLPGGNACLQVLEFLGEPVTGTSANISGRPGAGKAQEVVDQLGSTIDALLIDDSAAIYHKASTVVGLKDGTMTIHREGALSSDALRSASAARTTSQPPLIASRSRR
jgi:L-threonylcarbamoyladenylate synthase